MDITYFAVCTGLITVLAGGLIMVRALREAPEGYEDAEGFHVTRSARDVNAEGHSDVRTDGGGFELAA